MYVRPCERDKVSEQEEKIGWDPKKGLLMMFMDAVAEGYI